jgi:hypothetical protein
MDAWQFRRGRPDPPGFPDAVAAFVKQVRAHSPGCKIILFPWWIPAGPEATSVSVMKVFKRCVDIAPDDAKYLQEPAWKAYQREIKGTKPAK